MKEKEKNNQPIRLFLPLHSRGNTKVEAEEILVYIYPIEAVRFQYYKAALYYEIIFRVSVILFSLFPYVIIWYFITSKNKVTLNHVVFTTLAFSSHECI